MPGPLAAEELQLTTRAGEVLADLECLQGSWTPEQYARLTAATNHLIEFTAGRLDVLPPPTERHHAIVRALFRALDTLMQATGGTVFFAGLPLLIGPGKFRTPDLLLLRDARDRRRDPACWLGADLVVEVVGSGGRARDTVTKVADYSEAGIREYWIVDPRAEMITVLRPAEPEDRLHGLFGRGEIATSALLPGFAVSVDAVLDAP